MGGGIVIDPEQILACIGECLAEDDGALGDWTIRDDGELAVFDGRATVRAEIRELDTKAEDLAAHIHILTTLHEYDHEILDACLVCFGASPQAVCKQAAVCWMMGVAGPIKSFLDDVPLFLTCQGGSANPSPEEGYVAGDFGLPGRRLFVGPVISQGFETRPASPKSDDAMPWFRYAAEAAGPRRVHLAKATVVSRGKAGWSRSLEVDGDHVSLDDPDWPMPTSDSDIGYETRFAVFSFARDSAELAARAELDRAIHYYAENYGRHESIDGLLTNMIAHGFSPSLTHDVHGFAPIGFGRAFFEPLGASFSPTVIRARADGRVETNVPLLSIPAFVRGRVLAERYRQTLPVEEFQALCFYSAESNGILQATTSANELPDLTKFKFFPLVVPDPGASDATHQAALAVLQAMVDQDKAPPKKPWWKLW